MFVKLKWVFIVNKDWRIFHLFAKTSSFTFQSDQSGTLKVSTLGSGIQWNLFTQIHHGFVTLVWAIVQIPNVTISVRNLPNAISTHFFAIPNENTVFRSVSTFDKDCLWIAWSIPLRRSALGCSSDVGERSRFNDVKTTITPQKAIPSPTFSRHWCDNLEGTS